MIASASDSTWLQSRPQLAAVLLCLWLLVLMTFSAPGREGPTSAGGLDLIALAKLAARLLALAVLGFVLAQSSAGPRRAVVLGAMAPLGLFLGWAIFSTLWSPLRAVSLGQASGLMAQLMLAAALGLLCTQPRSWSVVIQHLCCALLTVSLLVLCVHAINPSISGLDRTFTSDGAGGIVHPTSAGATGSLGLLLLVAARLIWQWRWAGQLLWIGIPVHGLLLLLAASRTALGMTLVALVLLVGWYGYRVALAATILAGCTLGACYLALDADLSMARQTLGETTEYASRGESVESLSSFTGRTELWEAIWDEFRKSMLVGHGYFVTSETGLLNVWTEPVNRPAHNVLLQVLVSTGLIGAALFIWGLLRPLRKIADACRARAECRPMGGLLVIFGLWYFGWGQLCESFMGPVAPESVVFYSLFGLGLGLLSTAAKPEPTVIYARLPRVEFSR